MTVDTVVAAGGAPWEGEVVRALEADPDVRLLRRCVDLADLLAVVPTRSPRVAVVAVELSGLELDVVDELRRAGVEVLAVGDPARASALGMAASVSPAEISAAIGRVGAASTPEVLRAAETADVQPDGPPRRDGRVLAVWGPVGGPGRSTVATAVAGAVALRGHRTVLVDADVQGGVQAQALGLLDDTSGLLAASREVNQGRIVDVDRHAVRVEPDLSVLTGTARADMWSQLRVPALERLLPRLRDDHDLVVVDLGSPLDGPGGPRRPGDVARAVLQLADHVVVVGRADPVGLTRLVRSLTELSDAGLGSVATRLVLNRFRRSVGWSGDEVIDTLHRLTGHRVEALLPDDADAIDAAMVSGRLIQHAAPSSRLASAVGTLVDALEPTWAVADPTVRRVGRSRLTAVRHQGRRVRGR